MVKNIKSGDEYKVLKQTSRAKKIAWAFSLLWIVLILVPVLNFCYKNSNALKNYVVVKGVYEMNKTLMSQYNDLSANLVKNINISKYTSKIKVPEIKLDSVVAKTEKVSKAATALSAFGVKGAGKVADKTDVLQKQVDKINTEIRQKTTELTKTLDADLNKALKDELASFGRNQMQKQLQLSDANYKNLVNDNYGISSPASRKVSASIYSELSKNSHSVVKSVMNAINSYYTYIYWTLLVLVLVVGLLPVVIALKIAKLFTDNFTKCPYCGKVFLSKKAKFGIISKLKFW